MGKARIIRTSVETVVIPADSREQFLMQASPLTNCLEDFQILQAGLSRLTPGYLVERSPSYFHLMLYCHEGEAAVKVEDRGLRVKAGDVLMIPVGSSYSYHPLGAQWDISWVHLIDCPSWNRLFQSPPSLHKAQWGKFVRDVMRGYIGEVGTRHPDSRRVLRLYIEVLVSYLKRELGAALSEDREGREKLQTLWGRVHKDLRHKWAVEELSSLAGLCKTSLFHLCKKVHGMTPLDMIGAMRMELASERLAFTNETLAAIAEETGYKSAFAFSKAFKRHMGASPKEYRRQRARNARKSGGSH